MGDRRIARQDINDQADSPPSERLPFWFNTDPRSSLPVAQMCGHILRQITPPTTELRYPTSVLPMIALKYGTYELVFDADGQVVSSEFTPNHRETT